ncbi:MAG: XdhC family protein [Pseudomonadota bacterium]
MAPETLKRLIAARSERQTVLLATPLAGGSELVIDPADEKGLAGLSPPLREAVARAAATDFPSRLEADGAPYFINVFSPPPRLIVIGAVHIAQALIPMAHLAGYDAALIDPRTAFATSARFPGAAIDTRWPDEALAEMRLDRRSAVVVLTHDPKLDDPALHAALSSDAFYIGALGSRKTHARRLERLASQGFDEGSLKRISGPVGLPLGAKTPAEIAVSILAEMTGARRGLGRVD